MRIKVNLLSPILYSLLFILVLALFQSPVFAATGWNFYPGPDNDTAAGKINKLTAISSHDVWGIGDTPGNSPSTLNTYTTHYDGTGWTSKPSDNPGQSNALQGVALSSVSGTKWAVGYELSNESSNYQTLIEKWDDNTASWSAITSPNQTGSTADQLYGIAAIPSSDDMWAIGNYSNSNGTFPLFLLYTNGIWTPQPGGTLPSGVTQAFLTSVTAIASNNVYAAGYYYDSTGAKTLIEHFDGNGWTVVTSQNYVDPNNQHVDNYLNALAIGPNGSVYAGGYYDVNFSGAKPLILKLDSPNNSWPIFSTSTHDNNNQSGSVYDLTILPSGDLYTVGGGEITHFDGANWNTKFVAPFLGSIAAISSNDIRRINVIPQQQQL